MRDHVAERSIIKFTVTVECRVCGSLYTDYYIKEDGNAIRFKCHTCGNIADKEE